MARGNKGKKGRNNKGDDSSDDDVVKKVVSQPPPPATKGGAAAAAAKGGKAATATTTTATATEPALSRKQKKLQKQQQKQTTKKNAADSDDDDSDDDDDDDEAANILALIGGGKNKNKKMANRYGNDSDDDDDDDDDEKFAYGAASNKNKKKNRQPATKVAATKKLSAFQQDSDEEDDDDDDDDDEIKQVPIPEPVKKGAKNKNKNVSFNAKPAPPPPPPASLKDDDASDDDDDFLEEEEDEDDDEEVEQIAFAIIDDDDDDKKKKKKKKKDKEKDKDKKEKKSKKEKKEKKKDKKEKGTSSPEEDHNDKDQKDEPTTDVVPIVAKDDVVEVTEQVAKISIVSEKEPPVTSSVTPVVTAPKPSAPKPSAPKPKTKLELQIEEAMRKKEAAEREAESKVEAAARMAAEKERQEAEDYERMEREADEIRKKMEEEEQKELEEFYGHGDDAWNDKSAAQRAAELAALSGGGLDLTLTHGPDGKKLSNKERKKLIKDREAAARMAEYELVAAKASQEGAQFACSQTAVNEKDPQWENSLDINVPNFSISAAGKVLFKDAILSITKGRRYGLVGPNGKGKSTLLKMIASGDLKIPPRIDFLYVEQEVVADDTPAVEAVLKADQKRWDLLKEEEALMKALDAGDEDMDKIERLQVVTEELTNMGADSAEAKARRILFGLGFDMDMQVKPTKMFSGGWRMRISLARALYVEPTLLMLDEPTNHLDLNAVIWLDDYLQRWKNTLLVVSHDQDFLNSVTQEILHIEDLKLVSYKGNYDSFKKAEKIKFEQTVKAWEKQEKRLRELKRSGQSKAKAQENVKKNAKREPAGRNNKKTNDAIASGSQTATQAELISRPKEYQVRFHFTDVADIGRPVMEINQVHFRYSPKHPVIFDKVDFGIDMDSRICIVGPNGAGKSTLLKLMTGEIEPTRGEVKRNARLRMGVYNQHFVDKLPMNKTPIEFLRDRFQNEDYQSVRNRLGKYGLEGHAHEVVMRDLSGGQKARVTFVELSLQEPHLLLLDEPTNNLDIESIDALIDAINDFNGGIIVVTHDQRLIENCECNLWVVEKQKVTPWEKGFDDYKETLLTEMEEQIEKESKLRQKKLEEAAKVKAEKLALLASRLKR